MSILKRFLGIVLIGALLCPLPGLTGCTTQPKTKQPGVFSFPKTKKKPEKVKKDPRTPATVGDFLALPRNDVL
jgi:hypothetical protein